MSEKRINYTFDEALKSKVDLSASSLVDTGLNLLLYQPTENADCILGISVYKNGRKGTFLHPENFKKLMSYIESELLGSIKVDTEYCNPSGYYHKFPQYNRIIRLVSAHRISVVPSQEINKTLQILSARSFNQYARLCGVYDIAVLTRTPHQDTSTYIN